MTAESIAFPPPQGWTVSDLDRLPDDGNRYELIDGVVAVSPSPSFRHQRVSTRLCTRLESAAPSGVTVAQAVGVVLLADQCPIPDLVVLREPVDEWWNRYPAAQTLLVVEVVSPGTRSADRIRKPAQYAAAGIPNYWRVELDPVHVVAYRLDDEGTYAEHARAQEGSVFEALEPFAVSFDPAALVR